MKRLVDLTVFGLLMLLFVACLIMGFMGAWWNFFVAGGLLLIAVALYSEIKFNDEDWN